MAITFTLNVPTTKELIESEIGINTFKTIAVDTLSDTFVNGSINKALYTCKWFIIDIPTSSNASISPGNQVLANTSISLNSIDTWGTYRLFCYIFETNNIENSSEKNPLKAPESHFVNITVKSINNELEKPAYNQRNWREKYDKLVEVVDSSNKKINTIQVPGTNPAVNLTLPTSISANTYLKTNSNGQLTFSSIDTSDIEISNLSLNNLSDVDTVSSPPINGQALVYNNNEWAPGDVASSGIDLTDISVTSNASEGGGSLAYDNSTGDFSYTPPELYTNANVDARIQASRLQTLNQVKSDMSPTDGQVLKWNNSSSHWDASDDIANISVTQIQYDINALNPVHSVEGKIFYDTGTNTLTLQQPHLDDVIRKDDIQIVNASAVQGQSSSLIYNASGANGPTFTFQPDFLTNKIDLTDISVSTNAANSGGALSYNNSSGVFSFTPADVSGGGGGGLSNWTETNGHLLPNANETYDIGSADKKVRHLFLSDSSLNIGGANIAFDSTRKLLSMSNEGIGFKKSFFDSMDFDSVSTIQDGNYYIINTVGNTSLATWEALGLTNASSLYSDTTELSNASDEAKTFLAIRNGTGADGSGQIVPVDIVERALTIEEFKKDSFSGSKIFSLSYRTPNPTGFGNINHVIPSINSDPSVLDENAVLELNYNSWEWQWKNTSSIGGSFTGTHPSVIDNQENISLGMIVDSTGILWANETDSNVSTSIPKVSLSSTSNSKKCFGVISNTESVFATFCKKYGVDESEKQITINSLGEGKVWVTNIHGNIENGDYITTSEISGYGQLQSDDLLHNYTVAKCTEFVDWSNIFNYIEYNGIQYKKYLISCTYHCG